MKLLEDEEDILKLGKGWGRLEQKGTRASSPTEKGAGIIMTCNPLPPSRPLKISQSCNGMQAARWGNEHVRYHSKPF